MIDLKQIIRNIPGFPKPGIVFRDITTVLQNPEAFHYAVDALTEPYMNDGVDVVVGAEARGLIFGPTIAYKLGAAFVPVRKPGKLPGDSISASYELEYGTDSVEMHRDAITSGQRVLMVDDLLATGGTMAACCQLVEQLGGQIVGVAFLIELSFLSGRDKLAKYDIFSLVDYDAE